MHKPFFLLSIAAAALFAAPARADEPLGPRASSITFEAGPAPSPDRPVTVRRNTALMVSGIVLSALGAGTMIAGGVILRDADARASATCDGLGCMGQSMSAGWARVFSYAMLGGGGSFLAAGIPMTIVGAWPVAKKREAAGAPSVFVGPVSGMRFAF